MPGTSPEILKKVFPLLVEKLDNANNEGEIQVEAAASGAPTIIFNGIYIHSKRDPQKEAERLVELSGENNDTPAIVLGFGLGYTASALAKKFPHRPIIIIEKHPMILKKALEHRDLKMLLERQGLVFVMDVEGVTGALSLFKSIPGIPPLILRNRALIGLDEEWYAGVENKIALWNTRTNVNRATQKRFGRRWVRNLSQNLTALRDKPGITYFEGILRETNIPVFLAAAGPSLDQTSPILDEIFKRCIIISVDTSLRFLCGNGIESDFVLSVDPQFWNSRHMDWVLAPKTRLIAESAVYPALLRHPFGQIFLCGSFFPIGRFLEERLELKGDLGAGGSVATSAWDFARLLGAGSIWISGLDLSYPELKTHFRGALFEEISHALSGRFSPVETRSIRLLRDGQSHKAKSNEGGAVLTDQRLSLYASWFENRFSQFPLVKNYSLSRGGLEIKGLEITSKEEILALPECRDEINNLLKKVQENIENDFYSEEAENTRAEKYKNALETLQTGLEEIEKLSFASSKQASTALTKVKLGHLGENEQEEVLKKLDAANKTITTSSVKDIAGFLFPETNEWEAEIDAKKEEPLIRHLEFSSRFYRALAESAEYTAKLLSQG